ncbi:MAG TPA: SAM-dependent methyltransferase [Blastocatellia bacterium]|nr:SAM-dependent methyltransferase [Blastocatellia bacterium]
MDSQPTVLEQQIISRIERCGPITFRDFMQAALYDDSLGYYNSDRSKIGPEGDYYTSSNVHSAFGAILARCMIELWEKDSPAPLTLVEMGAGTGQLASDILTAIFEEHAPIASQIKYLIVETSPAMRALQVDRLAGFKEAVEWRELEALESAPLDAIFFSNELVDAFPVHRVRLSGRGLEELYVASTESGLRLRYLWGHPSTERLREYLERMQVRLPKGQIIEAGLDAIDWLGRVSRAIKRGHLMTIDYGDIAGHLYSPERREGTVRSFYRHRLVESPLERVGEQDVTASVNFTALIEYGRDFGLEPISYERQSAFLLRMGLIDKIAAMGASQNLDDLKSRLAIKNLFVPGGVSDNFRVLVQRKLR